VLALDVKTDSAHYNKAQQLKGGLTGEELRADLAEFFGKYTDEMAAAQKVRCSYSMAPLWLHPLAPSLGSSLDPLFSVTYAPH
jgi:hypothetical protein